MRSQAEVIQNCNGNLRNIGQGGSLEA